MKTGEAHELKLLQTRLDKLQKELVDTKLARDQAVASFNSSISNLQSQIGSMQQKIKQFKASSAEPIVSEHAMLRFFERILGFDLVVIKATILTPGILEQISTLGNGKFSAGEFRVIVRDNIVTSIDKEFK